MAAAVMASSMGFIDSSVTAIALPAIRASLGGSLAAATWVAGAYLLTLSALILAGGAMADRFGTVRVYALGIWIFILSSVACTLAQTMLQMNLARAAQGLGAALMVPGAMTLISRAYPRGERGAALGLWAAAATATTALGPVLGGALLSLGGPEVWRAIFALNLPLGAASLFLLYRFTLPDPGRPGTPVDVIGAALATLSLGALSWGLTHEGAALPALLPLAALAALAFLWHEARTPAPMIRLSIFAHRGFALANLATLLLYIALSGVMFYLPMTAIAAWDVSPLGVTAAFLPTSVMITLLSRPAGRLADRFGPGPLMSLGAALAALGYGLLSLAAVTGDFYFHVVPTMGLVGLGLALVVAPLTAAVMAYAPEADQGAASGINNAVARASGLISVALMGLVARAAYGTSGPGFGLPGQAPMHLAATATAFSHIAALAAVLALASALASALIGRRIRQ